MAKTGSEKSLPALPRHWVFFGIGLALIAALYGLYGANVARWPDSPDFGWRPMYDSGPRVVAEVFERGSNAGLRVGDRIEAINGRSYTTFDELYFGGVRHGEPGAQNTYSLARGDSPTDVPVTTGRLGIRAVLERSGPTLVIGLVYIVIGVLVFLMKPKAPESRLFFAMTSLMGMRVAFATPSDLIRPLWFYDIRFLLNVTLPAAIVHLALVFPKRRDFLRKRPWLGAAPYLLSFALFAVFKLTSTAFWNVPGPLRLTVYAYENLSLLFFLGSVLWNVLRDASRIVRLQSQVIFAGALLGFLIPASDGITRFLWGFYLFADVTLALATCLALFPLSIGYTIVKHDLFAIDVIVRRTYGYVLSTAAIIGAYALIVSTLNVTFQSSDVSRSPLFSIGFALVVVFLFEPLHRRIQRLVDHLFYRQQYDYRKTIKTISEAMTSILDPDLILKTLVQSVVKEMYLENGALLLLDPGRRGYFPRVVEGGVGDDLASRQVDENDSLVRAVDVKNDALLRHEVTLNPIYETERERLDASMQDLASELVMPLKYKEQMRGIMALGRKKSGKMFTPEDLDLLRTLTHQSTIALENAKLFQENLVKGRMEEELRIAHDIQLSMLPDEPPRVEGLRIAARSLPAREVGGDFYDFVVAGGDGPAPRVGIIVGDVSGKGVSGALLMSAARSTYRVLVEANPSVVEVMHLANQRLHRDIRKGMFVALVYAVYDPVTKALTLSNAGQTQPILCRTGEEPAYIDTEGDSFPLGILADSEYQETHLALKEGDILIFYTDGIVEAMNANEELYGFERLMASVHAARDLSAEELLEKLMADVSQFVGGVEQHDDLTIVVGRVT